MDNDHLNQKLFIDFGQTSKDLVTIVVSPVDGKEKSLVYDWEQRDFRPEYEQQIYTVLNGEVEKEYIDVSGIKYIEYPIHVLRPSSELKNDDNNRFMPQLVVFVFAQKKINALLGRDFFNDISQRFLGMLSEMTKNVVDHTVTGNLYLKILLSVDDKNGFLTFSFLLGDEGEGIYHEVSRKIQKIDPNIVYDTAFSGGWTSESHETNTGDGLEMIKNDAKKLNMDLLMVDNGKQTVLYQTKDVPLDTSIFKTTIDTISDKVKFYYIGLLSLDMGQELIGK